MKKIYNYLFLLSLLLTMACSDIFLQVRENILRIGTLQEVGLNSAQVNGLLLDVGEDLNLQVLSHGHCWSTNPEPLIETDAFSDFGSTEQYGEFGTILDGLNPETRYYVRAYVIDAEGIQYSDVLEFVPGIVRNTSVSNISTQAAEAEGFWSELFTGEILTVGHCWATNTRPTISNSRTEFNTNSVEEGTYFFSDLSGLSPATQYYIRSYATTTSGLVVYGDELTFKTVE